MTVGDHFDDQYSESGGSTLVQQLTFLSILLLKQNLPYLSKKTLKIMFPFLAFFISLLLDFVGFCRQKQ